MEGENADENRVEPELGGVSRRRITTKREPREARFEQSSTTEQHVPRRVLKKTAPQDGYREKAMRIANVENNTLNWVSISSAGALDMTDCDFSVRSARDEMRHIIETS